MSTSKTRQERETRFSGLYELVYTDVLRFVQRRAGPEHAEDIVHEAFLVTWRRLDDLPTEHEDARAWMFAVARNCMLNTVRGEKRQGALAVRIAAHASTFTDAATELINEHVDLVAAWRQLRPLDQEVLALAIWEELPSSKAGQVLGISSAAYRLRLHRARKSLRRMLDASASPNSFAEFLMTES